MNWTPARSSACSTACSVRRCGVPSPFSSLSNVRTGTWHATDRSSRDQSSSARAALTCADKMAEKLPFELALINLEWQISRRCGSDGRAKGGIPLPGLAITRTRIGDGYECNYHTRQSPRSECPSPPRRRNPGSRRGATRHAPWVRAEEDRAEELSEGGASLQKVNASYDSTAATTPRYHELLDILRDTPAHTLDGMPAKAYAIMEWLDSDYSDTLSDQCEDGRVAWSLARDLLRERAPEPGEGKFVKVFAELTEQWAAVDVDAKLIALCDAIVAENDAEARCAGRLASPG